MMTGLNQPIDVDGFAYAWAVYGPTKPGELYLGELYFIFEGPGKCEHMFPQFNFPDGHQPLVSVALFKAPDGGATAMLLVIALFGLGLAGRFGLRSVH